MYLIAFMSAPYEGFRTRDAKSCLQALLARLSRCIQCQQLKVSSIHNGMTGRWEWKSEGLTT